MLIKTYELSPGFWLAYDAEDAKRGCSVRGATGETEVEATLSLFALLDMLPKPICLPDRSAHHMSVAINRL